MQAVKGAHGTAEFSRYREMYEPSGWGPGGLGRWDISCPSSVEISYLAASLSWKRLSSPHLPWSTSRMRSATGRQPASPVGLLLHCRAPSSPLTLGRRRKWPGRGPAVGSGVRSAPISENCKISMKFLLNVLFIHHHLGAVLIND